MDNSNSTVICETFMTNQSDVSSFNNISENVACSRSSTQFSNAGKYPFLDVYLQYSPGTALFIGLVLLAVMIGTVIGNVLVCLAVFLVKKLRRPCNYLIVSLAIADICVAVLVMPAALIYELLGRWAFGKFMCDLWVSFDVLSCTASILNLCMISVDRYYAITKPLEYGVKRTPRRMLMWVVLVWLGAACVSLPPLLILGNDYRKQDGEYQCQVSQNFGYQLYATLGSFWLPLTVMILVYYKIFCAARRIVKEERKAQFHLEGNHCHMETTVKNGSKHPESRIASRLATFQDDDVSPRPDSVCSATEYGRDRNSDPTEISNNNNNGMAASESHHPMLRNPSICCRETFRLFKNKRAKESCVPGGGTCSLPGSSAGIVSTKKFLRFQLAKERKASTTLGIIMSAFTVCWLPFFVLALVRPFLSNASAIPRSLSSLFLWLGYANSLFNPVIYATLNRDFRRPFQQMLFFRCGSLNHMMREEFYHSQYGDPDPIPHYYVAGDHGGAGTGHLRRDTDDEVIQINARNSPHPSPNESFL